MNNKIIAVTGATGAQGGGLVRAILSAPDSGFQVRAITRDVNSDKAKALAALGVELVTADLDDRASLERAFAGAYGAFCITNFWEHFSAEKEVAQADNMAHAAKAAGVQHVIWSSLEDTRLSIPLDDPRMPVLHEKYKVPHFDGKGEADLLFKKLGLPVTILLTSFYWENFIYFGLGPVRGQDGKLGITFPIGDAKLPGIAAGDIGKCAFGIFQNGKEYIGKTVGIAGEHLTGNEMASSFTKALGKEVVFNDVSPDVYRTFPFPGAVEMGNMFQYKRDCEADFCGARDLTVARRLNPELMNFDSWLGGHAGMIKAE